MSPQNFIVFRETTKIWEYFDCSSLISVDSLYVMIAVKMCGLPNIFEPPKNMTLGVGDTAKFYCTVDMTCMVSYVEWYKQSDNGQYWCLLAHHHHQLKTSALDITDNSGS